MPNPDKLHILYEDPHYIAVNKPAGILTQRDLRTGWSLYDQVREHLNGGFTGIVHRLDRAVSGVLVFARHPAAAAGLCRAIREKKVSKIYHAVCEGTFNEPEACLRHYIRKKGHRAVVFGRPGPFTREAVLEYRVLGTAGGNSLISILLVTGRYNQIRAQLAYIRRPVCGDNKYRKNREPTEAIALQARELKFIHPFTKESISIKVDEYPEYWEQFWR